MQIEAEVTVLDLDEALAHVAAQLKIDEYGERMSWRKKEDSCTAKKSAMYSASHVDRATVGCNLLCQETRWPL